MFDADYHATRKAFLVLVLLSDPCACSFERIRPREHKQIQYNLQLSPGISAPKHCLPCELLLVMRFFASYLTEHVCAGSKFVCGRSRYSIAGTTFSAGATDHSEQNRWGLRVAVGGGGQGTGDAPISSATALPNYMAFARAIQGRQVLSWDGPNREGNRISPSPLITAEPRSSLALHFPVYKIVPTPIPRKQKGSQQDANRPPPPPPLDASASVPPRLLEHEEGLPTYQRRVIADYIKRAGRSVRFLLLHLRIH